MFRKRKITILEKSLVGEGVAVRSDVGSALLNKMIELGYSDYEVYLKPNDVTPTVLLVMMHKKGVDFWLASIEVIKSGFPIDDKSEIDLWWPYEPKIDNGAIITCDKDEMTVYSKYDIYGKLITSV